MYSCSKCDKPFADGNSRDRHILYCGSRVRRRQRSCQACKTAKTKCSFNLPCTRCTRKGIECTYESAILRREHAPLSAPRSGRTQQSTPVVNAVKTFASDWGYAGNDSLSNIGAGLNPEKFLSVEWLTPQSLIDGSQNSDPFPLLDETSFDSYQPRSVSTSASDISNLQTPVWCKWAGEGLALAVVSGRHAMKSKTVSGMRPVESAAQQSANLIVQSLRAFPTMMLRRETWPWFIHPHSHLLFKSSPDLLPDTLSTCMAVAQMYVLGASETKRFVWQTIRAETWRFSRLKQEMSEYEALAALQACMMYLIMHIIEGVHGDEQIGTELLHVLYDLYVFYKTVYYDHVCESEVAKPSKNWAEWIFAESRRRLSNLWLLVGCVVRVRTNGAHDEAQSHRIIPLPCSRSLWEASSESAWRIEYEASRVLVNNGLVCLGDLVDAQTYQEIPTYSRTLDLWNANADHMGFLLNLVYTMV